MIANKTTPANMPPYDDPQAAETKRELSDAIHNSYEVLHSASTVFPLSIFPDTVTLDRTKLTIIHRSFFSTAEVMSIRVEDILNVTVQAGPFFGSLHIVSRIMNPDKPYTITNLRREDALKLKRIMQGYIIAIQNHIDCTPFTTPELADMLNELGKDDHPRRWRRP